MLKRKDSKCANKIGENTVLQSISNLKFRIKIMKINIQTITFLVKFFIIKESNNG